jgi:hypothetical protein
MAFHLQIIWRSLLGVDQQTSSALVIWRSLLGPDWKDILFCMCWLEGRMRALRALLTHSPSTPPNLAREFAIEDFRAFNGDCSEEEEVLYFL